MSGKFLLGYFLGKNSKKRKKERRNRIKSSFKILGYTILIPILVIREIIRFFKKRLQ